MRATTVVVVSSSQARVPACAQPLLWSAAQPRQGCRLARNHCCGRQHKPSKGDENEDVVLGNGGGAGGAGLGLASLRADPPAACGCHTSGMNNSHRTHRAFSSRHSKSTEANATHRSTGLSSAVCPTTGAYIGNPTSVGPYALRHCDAVDLLLQERLVVSDFLKAINAGS